MVMMLVVMVKRMMDLQMLMEMVMGMGVICTMNFLLLFESFGCYLRLLFRRHDHVIRTLNFVVWVFCLEHNEF